MLLSTLISFFILNVSWVCLISPTNNYTSNITEHYTSITGLIGNLCHYLTSSSQNPCTISTIFSIIFRKKQGSERLRSMTKVTWLEEACKSEPDTNKCAHIPTGLHHHPRDSYITYNTPSQIFAEWLSCSQYTIQNVLKLENKFALYEWNSSEFIDKRWD